MRAIFKPSDPLLPWPASTTSKGTARRQASASVGRRRPQWNGPRAGGCRGRVRGTERSGSTTSRRRELKVSPFTNLDEGQHTTRVQAASSSRDGCQGAYRGPTFQRKNVTGGAPRRISPPVMLSLDCVSWCRPRRNHGVRLAGWLLVACSVAFAQYPGQYPPGGYPGGGYPPGGYPPGSIHRAAIHPDSTRVAAAFRFLPRGPRSRPTMLPCPISAAT